MAPRWLAIRMRGSKLGRGIPLRAPLAINRCLVAALCLALLMPALQNVACSRAAKRESPQREIMPGPDINDALRAHDQELLAVPGVVGVYVGVLDDENTPCLKVMIVKRTPELEQKIPKSLEGYTVVMEETGAIRPMPKK